MTAPGQRKSLTVESHGSILLLWFSEWMIRQTQPATLACLYLLVLVGYCLMTFSLEGCEFRCAKFPNRWASLASLSCKATNIILDYHMLIICFDTWNSSGHF